MSENSTRGFPGRLHSVAQPVSSDRYSTRSLNTLGNRRCFEFVEEEYSTKDTVAFSPNAYFSCHNFQFTTNTTILPHVGPVPLQNLPGGNSTLSSRSGHRSRVVNNGTTICARFGRRMDRLRRLKADHLQIGDYVFLTPSIINLRNMRPGGRLQVRLIATPGLKCVISSTHVGSKPILRVGTIGTPKKAWKESLNQHLVCSCAREQEAEMNLHG